MTYDALPPGAAPWLAPLVLAVELFAIFIVPLLVFHKSGLFRPDVALQLAAGVAILFYLALPDPIDVGFVDDLFIAALLGFLVVPAIRERVLNLILRRPPSGPPRDVTRDITIDPRKESDAGV